MGQGNWVLGVLDIKLEFIFWSVFELFRNKTFEFGYGVLESLSVLEQGIGVFGKS
jgi:hypothetical protein